VFFVNSDEIQRCGTDDGKFGCLGRGTCIADVSGKKGEKLTWKSSCNSYGYLLDVYTIIDGESEYAEFKNCAFESNETRNKLECDRGSKGVFLLILMKRRNVIVHILVLVVPYIL